MFRVELDEFLLPFTIISMLELNFLSFLLFLLFFLGCRCNFDELLPILLGLPGYLHKQSFSFFLRASFCCFDHLQNAVPFLKLLHFDVSHDIFNVIAAAFIEVRDVLDIRYTISIEIFGGDNYHGIVPTGLKLSEADAGIQLAIVEEFNIEMSIPFD
jgi:hypothetical protein